MSGGCKRLVWVVVVVGVVWLSAVFETQNGQKKLFLSSVGPASESPSFTKHALKLVIVCMPRHTCLESEVLFLYSPLVFCFGRIYNHTDLARHPGFLVREHSDALFHSDVPNSA